MDYHYSPDANGGRFDDLAALNEMPLILRAKLAWAHDWVSNPSLNASFESLPSTSFTVNGAPIPHDSALTSAGAQLFFTPNWSFLAKFDDGLAVGSQLYAGSGTLRYTWLTPATYASAGRCRLVARFDQQRCSL